MSCYDVSCSAAREPNIYLSGRKLTNYGPRDMWVLNPEKLITYNPLRSNSEKKVVNQFI